MSKKRAQSPRQAFGLIVSFLLIASLAAAPALVAEEPVCKDFDKDHRILRLGANPFSKEAVSSPVELQKQLEAHRGEIAALLEQHGLGHLTGSLIATVESGRGLSERDLERGEVFEWMAARKKGEATSKGPVCLAAKKTYGAYEIEVTEEDSHPADVTCAVRAAGMCADEKISVDAAGSSDGVTVTMTGPGGELTVISGGSTSWEGMPSGPGEYTFTATAEATGTKTVTTHSFMAPKLCLNLAYSGKSSEEMPGEATSCTKTATVTVEDCKPNCLIEAPENAMAKEPFTINATGRFDNLVVKATDEKGRPAKMTDADGNKISEITSFPATVIIKKGGVYTFEGTATNRAGTATCTTPITIERPEMSAWTLRGFLAGVKVDDNSIFTSVFRSNGVNERSDLRLKSGEAIGAGLEYHFSERFGLEGQALFGNLDSQFMFDLDEAWETDKDDASLTSFLLGPNFHLSPDSSVDFYFGPFVGLVDIGGTSYRVLGETHRRDFDTDLAYGAQLGLDIPVGGGSWALHFGAKYIDLAVEVGEEEVNEVEVNLDPLIGEFGFAFNF